MRLNNRSRNMISAGRVALGATSIVLLLGLLALCSSPTLHLRACPNAGRPGHHCAATDLAAGLAEVPPVVAIVLVVPAVFWPGWPIPGLLHRASLALRLSPSRAPPEPSRCFA